MVNSYSNRDVPFSFIFFPASAYFKSLAADRDRARGGTGKVSFGQVFGSGIAAGVLAAGAVTPADGRTTSVLYSVSLTL